MRLALAQINSVVGDVDGNASRIVEWLDRARGANADLVLFPELAVTGYPPEDLLLRPGFVRAARQAVERIAKETKPLNVRWLLSAPAPPGTVEPGSGTTPGVLPPPVAGKTVNVKVAKGKVRVKLPGSKKFVELTDPRQVPLGTIFDPATTRSVIAGQVDPVTGRVATGTGFVRDPFPGNILPAGRLDPNAPPTYMGYPLTEDSLTGVAPAIVITAECDVLHDDGERYADALRRAGVPVEYKEFPGMIHAFLGMVPAVDDAMNAQRLV